MAVCDMFIHFRPSRNKRESLSVSNRQRLRHGMATKGTPLDSFGLIGHWFRSETAPSLYDCSLCPGVWITRLHLSLKSRGSKPCLCTRVVRSEPDQRYWKLYHELMLSNVHDRDSYL